MPPLASINFGPKQPARALAAIPTAESPKQEASGESGKTAITAPEPAVFLLAGAAGERIFFKPKPPMLYLRE